jgi:hypothetical protein
MKIGFSMALTGAYAGNGKAALLATQMWARSFLMRRASTRRSFATTPAVVRWITANKR